MGLFNSAIKKEDYPTSANGHEVETNTVRDIPESLFKAPQPSIERPTVSERSISQVQPIARIENNIDLLFQFMDKNHEKAGYDDALINPDTTHLDSNIAALKNELSRTIRKVRTYYEDFIREIDFHIESRSRSGMIDTVDELRMKKNTAESHIEKVREIEESAKKGEGEGQGILISYTKGFKSGLTAISFHTILNRSI